VLTAECALMALSLTDSAVGLWARRLTDWPMRLGSSQQLQTHFFTVVSHAI
jgi:hypothetical protein